MGKRTKSDFARREKDFYPTPVKSARALLSQLRPRTRFYEPCARGHHVGHLKSTGHICVGASDAERDARVTRYDVEDDDTLFITNPPFHGVPDDLHPLSETRRSRRRLLGAPAGGVVVQYLFRPDREP
jgi:hypothetical protein